MESAFNDTVNDSSFRDAPTDASRVISGVLLVTFGIVGIPSNVLNFYVFASKTNRNKLRIRTSTTHILANLTAVDMIGSCINIPLCFCLFVVHYNSKTNTILSRIHFLITSPFLLLNCICLILLSLDRHDAILRSHRYRLTDGRLKLALVISWTLSFAVGFLSFLKQTDITLWQPESYKAPSPNSLLFFAGIVAVICTLFSYFKIRNALKVKRDDVVNIAHNQRVRNTREAAERRIAIAMVLITLTLVLTYTPWGGVMIAYRFINIRFHVNVYVICRVMLLLSHVTQPFIYFGVSREFRRVVRGLMLNRSVNVMTTDQSTVRAVATKGR